MTLYITQQCDVTLHIITLQLVQVDFSIEYPQKGNCADATSPTTLLEGCLGSH